MNRWIYGALARKMNSIDGNGVLIELNELTNRVGLAAMTTAAVLSFQVDDSSLYLSYAGHPPVWIRRFGETMWQPRMEERRTALANLPLGVFPEATYDQEKIHLHEGDRLFVHTDGLTEASSPSGQEFGADRLRAVLAEAGDESLFELKEPRSGSGSRAHRGHSWSR